MEPSLFSSLSSLAYSGPTLKSRKELFAEDVPSTSGTLQCDDSTATTFEPPDLTSRIEVPSTLTPSTSGSLQCADLASTTVEPPDLTQRILQPSILTPPNSGSLQCADLASTTVEPPDSTQRILQPSILTPSTSGSLQCNASTYTTVLPPVRTRRILKPSHLTNDCREIRNPTIEANLIADVSIGVRPLPSTPRRKTTRKATVSQLRQELADKKKTIHRLKARLTRLERRKPKVPIMSHAEIVAASKPILNPTMNRLLEAQFKLKKCKSNKGMRWSDDMKDFATSLLYHGPRSYRFLRKLMPLPSVSTLNKYQRKAYLTPGIHRQTKEFLKDNVKKWSVKKKVCTLVIDEISIKENLQYDERDDLIVGFADDGAERSKEVGNQVIVAALKGIDSAWKQVIGHWISFDKDRTKSIVKAVSDCIQAANEIGLIVKLLICDQGSKNRKLARLLKVTKRKPYFMNGREKVYFMWDPPHLLKSIRNNLMKRDFLWRKGVVSWSHFRALLKHQQRLRLHLIPKITRGHLYFRSSFAKMKVKLASQVLSRSVYTALLVFIALNLIPSSAVHTANFTKDLNDLFDCFNGMQYAKDKLSLRYAISTKSDHIPFLKKILSYFNSAAFLKSKRQPACLEGWIISITALLELVGELAERFGISNVRARLLSQDMLENMFGILRQQQGCNDNPTVKQVEKGLRHLTLSSLAKISDATNCEEEVEKSLIVLSKLPAVIRRREEEIEPTPWLNEIVYEKMDIVEENALYYCCGFITRAFMRKHKCNFCEQKLLLEGDERIWTEDYQMFLYFKAHSDELGEDFGHLQAPSYESFLVLKKMERVFYDVFAARCNERNISKIIKLAFKSQNLTLQLCTDEAEDQFASTLIRLRILWEVRFMNRRIVTLKCDRLDEKKKSKKANETSSTGITATTTEGTSEETGKEATGSAPKEAVVRALNSKPKSAGAKRAASEDRKHTKKLKKLRHE